MKGRRSCLMAIVAATAAAAAASGCTHAPWNPYGGWRAVRTKHITLYTNTLGIYERVLEPMEIAYAGLSSSMFRDTNLGPVEVLFLETEEFEGALGLHRNGVAIGKLPGEGRLGGKGLVVVEQEARGRAAAHKLTHLFLHAQMPKAPLWLHEAYASYLENMVYRDGGGGAEVCLGFLNTDEALLPIEEMFSISWRQLDESKKVDWFRHTGRSLLDFLLLGEGGRLRGKLAIFSSKLSRGNDSKSSFALVFPDITIAQFHEKMLEYRKDSEMRPRGLCPVRFAVPPDRRVDDGKPVIEPVSKEDIERLITRVWLLPRRAGYVDWYPPEAVTLAGAFAP